MVNVNPEGEKKTLVGIASSAFIKRGPSLELTSLLAPLIYDL